MRICARCVMNDQGDPSISFDADGICNYCTEALKQKDLVYFPNNEGARKLESLIAQLKQAGETHKYDCLMGISGGLDSSYLLYLGACEWGLRILAIHVDDGFNTEVSNRNIARLAALPNVTLKRIHVDQQQYNTATRAFIRAGVPNLAMIQDNALFAVLYQEAKKEGISYFLSGTNFALESVLQRGNTHDIADMRNIKAIVRRFGGGSLSRLKLMNAFQRDLYAAGLGIKTVKPLDWIDYNRDRAMAKLQQGCGFEYYGSKHLENTLTKFLQVYWLPRKFLVDKRKSHLSSLIVSNQLSRAQALNELENPPPGYLMQDEEALQLMDQLKLPRDEFLSIMKEPGNQHDRYPTSLYIRITGTLRRLRWKFLTRNGGST